MRQTDLVVIGGGPAGLAAAVEARRNGVERVVVLEREQSPGGILRQCVHNGFGLHIFGEELTGPEYAERFINRARAADVEIKPNTMVIGVEPDKTVTAVNGGEGLLRIKAEAVVLAMGCRERTRGALNIPGSRPAGIYTAGTAQRLVNIDGYMPGRKVVILGSGDIGLIMARRMTLEGAEVRMVCEIMPYPGGLKRNIVQCLEDFDIPLRLSHTVVQIHGNERLEGVTVAKVDGQGRPVPGTFEYVECDTLLLSVGLIPENELSRAISIDIDPATSGPVVDESAETSLEGVFACGNVVCVHDLADHVTMEGYLAGKSAAEYILGKAKGKASETLHICAGEGVLCVIPQVVRKNCGRDVKLFFRVSGVFRDVRLEARDGDKVLCSVKKRIVVPGEMESVTLSKEAIECAKAGKIRVCVAAGRQ